MDQPRVLVVEDDENVRRLIEAYLQREGFDIVTAADGEQGWRVFQKSSPDLVLLDIMLPKLDGWELCERIRSFHSTPVIMLTARGEELDRIRGLELGADDYITKPFSPKELVLRVQAVLRRANGAEQPEKKRLHFPGLTIDYQRRLCRVGGDTVRLTKREFDLLWHMVRHPGQAFEREQLLRQVWGYDFVGDARTIDVHITRLREKLHGKNEEVPYEYLHTVWGVGYKFEVMDAET